MRTRGPSLPESPQLQINGSSLDCGSDGRSISGAPAFQNDLRAGTFRRIVIGPLLIPPSTDRWRGRAASGTHRTMKLLIHLLMIGNISTATHADEVGKFLADALARFDRCAPSARIEGACAQRSGKAATTAELAARLFTTQLIRIQHFADIHPDLAHAAFGQALDQVLTVYGLRYPDQEARNRLEETGLLMAYTEENIDRFWQSVHGMWSTDRKVSDPKVWFGRLVVGAGGPRLTYACEDRLSRSVTGE